MKAYEVAVISFAMISGERRVFASALVVSGPAPEDNIFIKSALGTQFTPQPS